MHCCDARSNISAAPLIRRQPANTHQPTERRAPDILLWPTVEAFLHLSLYKLCDCWITGAIGGYLSLSAVTVSRLFCLPGLPTRSYSLLLLALFRTGVLAFV